MHGLQKMRPIATNVTCTVVCVSMKTFSHLGRAGFCWTGPGRIFGKTPKNGLHASGYNSAESEPIWMIFATFWASFLRYFELRVRYRRKKVHVRYLISWWALVTLYVVQESYVPFLILDLVFSDHVVFYGDFRICFCTGYWFKKWPGPEHIKVNDGRAWRQHTRRRWKYGLLNCCISRIYLHRCTPHR